MLEVEAFQQLLEVTNVGIAFGRREVLRDVTFVLKRGEVVAVTGESGCGKSTLARCIAGISHPNSGSIAFSGARGQRQMLFQDNDGSLNPHLTIREIVEEPLRILGLPRGAIRVAELLDAVRLPQSMVNRRPRELSGGQRQRVAIARALAPEPLLLIADEPAASLDPSLQAEVLLLLREMQARRGLSLLLISHNMELVGLMALRTLALRDGRIAAAMPPREL